MIQRIRSAVVLIVVLALLLSCAPFVFAANTSLTYREYLAMTTEEQIAFRETFDSSADFKKWYLSAKKTYEDSQNNIIIGDGNSVDLGEILNPSTATGTCGDNLTWKLSKSGILTISGSGKIDDYSFATAPWNTYADQILKVELPSNLTIIGENAFSACSAITDVYYAGTVNQWSSVTVSVGNSNITNATMHYQESILEQITVETMPDKTVYGIGDALDTTGLVLKLHYNDGSTDLLNAGFHTTSLDSATTGTKTITVSYLSKSTTFNVSVVATPTGISVASNPTKTEYWIGEALNTAGLSLNVTYSDGTDDTVFEGFTVSGFDSATPGTKVVTVHYLGYTATFPVIVKEITVTQIAVLTMPNKTTYWVGAELDTTGLSLTATYSNDSTATIETGYEISGFDAASEGTVTVTVTFQGVSTTFEVIISNDGRCGDTLSWVIEDGILTISGSGSMYDYQPGTAPWYGEDITSVVIDPAVTYIGNYAFANMPCFTAFTVDNHVTIGIGVFAQCSNLTAITANADHPAYYTDENGVLYSKDKTTLIAVPCSLSNTFAVPNTVTAIAESAFNGCKNLTAVRFLGNTSASGGFMDRTTSGTDVSALPVQFGSNNVTSIGASAFANCTKLTSLEIPSQVSVINRNTFVNCSALKNLYIPKSVTAIDVNAFLNCGKLTTVTYAGRETVSATSSAAAWNKITIAEGNDLLTDATKIYAGEVRISGATLALQHNIAVHYNVKKTTVETYGFDDLKLVVKFNGVTTTITDYVETAEEYVFYFNNIAPNQMNDTIVCALYAIRDGKTYVSDKREYSVATYCYTQLGRYSSDTYEEFRTLLVDLLNYGAAAQNYTSYNTDSLVNNDLTAEQISWGSSNTPALTDNTNTKFATIENPAVKWKGATLVLQDAVTMRYKIQASDLTNLTAVFTCDGSTWVIPASEFVQADTADTYYIFFNGLNAGQMRSLVHVTIYNGETPVSNTVQYSIESYASGKVATAGLSDIVIAMMRYGDSAYAYVN